MSTVRKDWQVLASSAPVDNTPSTEGTAATRLQLVEKAGEDRY
jgi:hypothetical protein